MRVLTRVFVFFCFFYAATLAVAQGFQSQLFLQSKVEDGKVKLRWAPVSEEVWQNCNHSGYILSRSSIVANGEIVPTPSTTIIGEYSPLSLGEWEALKDNDLAMVAAQSLYGDEIKVEADIQDNPVSLYQVSRQGELRYSLALLAADRDVKVARYLGLYEEDTPTQNEEKIYYRVTCNVGSDTLAGDILVDLNAVDKIPSPDTVQLSVSDGRALLSWEQNSFRKHVSNRIYRSVNGGQFTEIDQAVVQTSIQEEENSRVFLDSVPPGTRSVAYRVSGVDLFGSEGPATQTAQVTLAEGEMTISVEKYEVLDKGRLLVFLESGSGIDSVTIIQEENPGRVLAREVCPCESLEIDTNSSLMIVANAYRDGKRFVSLPYYLHVPDDEPPLPPEVELLSIDSTNILRFKISARESDLRGYRVFRSVDLQGPFIELTTSPLSDSVFMDSIAISLTDSVFYRFQLEDLNFNRSEMTSVPVSIISIGPITQSFSQYSIVDDSIRLDWEKHPGFTGYFILRIGKSTDTIYTTKEYFHDTVIDGMGYALVGVTGQGVHGVVSDTLTVQGQVSFVSGNPIEYFINRSAGLIRFTFGTDNITEVKVFRGLAGEPLRLYQVRDNFNGVFEDIDLKVNTVYTYRFQIVSSTEGVILSDRIEIQY